MKMRQILMVGLALPAMQPAHADVPFTSHSLGMVESTLAFCAESDAQAATKYQERAVLMVRAIPATELARARDSAEYKEAYSSIAATLAGLPKDQVKQTCNEMVAHNEAFAKPSK